MTWSRAGAQAYSEAELEFIEKALKDGLSASQIVSVFFKEFGRYVSRNGIIGVVNRKRSASRARAQPIAAAASAMRRPASSLSETMSSSSEVSRQSASYRRARA